MTRCVLKLDFAHAWRGKSINVYNRTHSLFMCFWDQRRWGIGEKIEARGDKQIANGYESGVVGREGLAK